jgi:two-component system copper resistance phosphate regulon response regulator CusR
MYRPVRSPTRAVTRRFRILIAEDEARVSSFLEKGLHEHGFATVVAERGSNALHLARSGRFDLVILDLGLPEMDGIDVLRALRKLNPALPVIVVTARSGTGDTIGGLESGANIYITKPFRFDELVDQVRRLLSEA